MTSTVTATTRLAAVIGDPVRHSMSPAIHNAAFEACGVDGVYVALPVAAGCAPQAVDAMRNFDWLGLSVTMPHKQAVMAACDELTTTAQLLGAVNCVFWRDAKIVGDSTDGEGYVRGLQADLGVSAQGLRCVLVGAGGAAGAVARSLADNGASSVAIVNRTAAKAEAVASLAGAAGRVGSMDDLTSADLVINATPIGMGSTDLTDAVPFDVSLLRSDAVVSDLIYHPAETLLLSQARSRGLRAQNGLPMLIHQAVVAFEHWTGVAAPVDVMTAAVGANLKQ
ncbi:MAG: shikimate dehydrogenase [Acidimicrobiales bacterium]|jgi:shikimate dehydrogenase